MNVSKLSKAADVERVLGVDGSSKSLAFCLMELDGDEWRVVEWGKLDIDGTDVYERCGDINRKLYGLMKLLHPDHVSFESVIFVNNRAVVIQLAKIIGAAIGVVKATGRTVTEVPPITWMNYIGNPTRDDKTTKDKVRRENPGKSANWYKQELRRMRKARTQDWVKTTYGIDIDDDDVSDAFGIAYYTTQELV